MRVTSLLAAVAFAASALGDGNTIRNAMRAVGSDTTALGSAVTAWRGNLLGALPIVGKTGGLLVSLKHGARIAAESTPLTTDEALSIATATTELSAAVNKTLDALIAARPKFHHLHVTPLIVIVLDVQRAAAADFSAKVVAKVPKELQAIAQELVKDIDNSFDRAVDAYH